MHIAAILSLCLKRAFSAALFLKLVLFNGVNSVPREIKAFESHWRESIKNDNLTGGNDLSTKIWSSPSCYD